ncbi:PAS-domain containing protein [Primorskyibacter sp. S87]|uniref:hybrid sensor histidine kinase/response regulator n=1 Tax=Primorskyibacter sp. S87 TaxID=3415126 RepID=UPI003C7A1E24
MTHSLINPSDSLPRQNEKLLKIVETLMRRVEQDTNASGLAYSQFQRAVLLEEEVRARTRDLERALELLNESNAQLAVANRETEAARQNLANAIETVQEGFALFSPDDVLVMCNSRFGMHMPDIRRDLNPGLSFSDYVQTVSGSVFLSLPENSTTEDWARQRMAHHAEPSVIFNVRMTGRRWVQVSERRTPDGGTVILQTDVTDIMRLERQERERILDDQARLIRATLEHLKQGVCIFDNLGHLVGWNRRVGELLSIPVGRFHIGSRFSTILDRMQNDYRFIGEVSHQQIEAWPSLDGKRAPLSFEIQSNTGLVLTVFMQQMPDGGFVISFTDVTAERQAIRAMAEAKETLEQRVLERTLELEDALSEAERANASKTRFVAAASHDLLQPLSAAKLYVASLEPEVQDAQARTVVGRASAALQSVENILSALLDISKLDSGQASVHVTTVSLDLILRQLRDELRPMAEAKQLDFRVLPTGALVRSDATYLRRVLQNLMMNAIRYTDEGRVLVGARQRGRTVRVEVWDTGPGIAESEQETIFGEFQRLNASASAADGMGLGLAIVDRACALLRHPLALTSEVGRGSVFRVDVPRASKEDVADAETGGRDRENSEISGGKLHNLIVLLIENDTDLRDALTLTMEKWGVNVLPSETESEALALLDEIGVAPDVIVADMQLDGGSEGSGAIRRLRQRCGPLPACLISANRNPELLHEARELGVPLLHKPIDPATLQGFLVSVAD